MKAVKPILQNIGLQFQKQRNMKTVKEIMVTFPDYIEQQDSLQRAAEQMTNSNIGSLPVVDENNKLVGIITDRDITLTAGSHRNKKLSDIKIHAVIGKREIHTVTPDDDLETALHIMRTKQVGRLPVIDEDKNLRGVVTLHHILRKIYGSNDHARIGYEGAENVMDTLHSIAQRKEFVFTS
jgi:CBS domain-containing protein